MLTAFAIENAKPREKVYRLSDGNGLALQVETNGSKLWRFRYRFGGKENMLTFGAFPEVALSAAREKRTRRGSSWPLARTPRSNAKTRSALSLRQRATLKIVATDYIAKLKAEGRRKTR